MARYAMISGNSVVNIIALNDANAGDFPGAVKLTVPAGIGDNYKDGKFYRSGAEVVAPSASDDELTDALTALSTLGYKED